MTKKSRKLDKQLQDNKFVLIDLDNCRRWHFNGELEILKHCLYKVQKFDAIEMFVGFMNTFGGDYDDVETYNQGKTEKQPTEQKKKGRKEN